MEKVWIIFYKGKETNGIFIPYYGGTCYASEEGAVKEVVKLHDMEELLQISLRREYVIREMNVIE